MTSETTGRRVYTKRTLAQRAAEAQDKAIKLQAAAERQRARCLVELGGALVAVLRTLKKNQSAWLELISTTDVRNKKRRAEAIDWLRHELGLPALDAPAEEFQVTEGVTPPTK